MSVDQAYNFRQVSDSISTAGVLGEDQLGALQREGYTAVINLLPEDSEYAIRGERDLVLRQGLSYTHIPVDFSAPRESDYRAFEAAMRELQGARLMIHCAANYRVSAFYAIYARRNLGWTAEQGGTFIAAIWNPSEHKPWDAFIAELTPHDER
jgi:protein tyrosine phosphatase (PTP) superfamily phosphohydrolase (DUF442 family)